MTIIEIKKGIYKKNPTAKIFRICGGILYYRSELHDGVTQPIFFDVPVSDIGTTDFYPEMPAKHLLRWIVEEGIFKTNKL